MNLQSPNPQKQVEHAYTNITENVPNRTGYGNTIFNCTSADLGMSGVPQGSILGPLSKGLVSCISIASNSLDFVLFADDTTILHSHNDIRDVVLAISIPKRMH